MDIPLLFTTVHLHGAALFNFIVAIAMFLVAVTSPFMGAFSDSLAAKKRFLAVYLSLGVFSTAMLATIHEGDWLSGAVWFILADIGFAGGNVFYNAFLKELASPGEMGKVSGWGWGIGYLGGGLLLALNLVMLQAPQLIGFAKGFFTVQHTFLSVAVWWGMFSIPLLVKIRDRSSFYKSREPGVVDALHRLIRTFREVRKFRQLWKFLTAYLLFNDGIETVIIMASIFGALELGMNQSLLISFFLLIQFTAFCGSLLFGRLTIGLGNKRTLLLTLFIWCAVVISAYFIGWSGSPVREYFVIGIAAGIVMGASQSLARGLQGEFTPKGREAEFFGFFAVSGRFASLFGPLTYGLVVALTGSLRAGILSLIFFFIIGIIILYGVDEEEGKRVAETALD